MFWSIVWSILSIHQLIYNNKYKTQYINDDTVKMCRCFPDD